MSMNNPEDVRDYKSLDIYQPEGINYPIIEATNNALIWPEGPKGNIDLDETYEVSSVPEDPGTPMETIQTLEEKGVVPN
jgi:hypothetical protein